MSRFERFGKCIRVQQATSDFQKVEIWSWIMCIFLNLELRQISKNGNLVPYFLSPYEWFHACVSYGAMVHTLDIFKDLVNREVVPNTWQEHTRTVSYRISKELKSDPKLFFLRVVSSIIWYVSFTGRRSIRSIFFIFLEDLAHRWAVSNTWQKHTRTVS